MQAKKNKKRNCATKSFYISLTSLLITTVLLTAVSIYCYLIKHKAKTLITYYFTPQRTN